MGFDHEKTTHHFLLTKSGGVIQVSANDPKDTESRDAIQQHMGHIAKMFSEGDFNAPMLIHAQTPPGVPEMKANLKAITWKPVNTKTGANIVITSKDPAADQGHPPVPDLSDPGPPDRRPHHRFVDQRRGGSRPGGASPAPTARREDGYAVS